MTRRALGPLRGIALQNAPANLGAKYRGARRKVLPLSVSWLARTLPGVQLPISRYFARKKLIGATWASREVETRLVRGGCGRDPDCDRG